jgi:hypothetical protein
MSWPVDSPDRFAARTGAGETWIPARHTATLTAPGFTSWYDRPEITEFVAQPDTALPPGWQAIYYDSPRTLRPKLALTWIHGLAGAGFWAIGYERGLPGYLELMRDFRAGSVQPPSPASLSER